MFAIKAKQRLHNCIIKTQFILFVKPDKMLDKAELQSLLKEIGYIVWKDAQRENAKHTGGTKNETQDIMTNMAEGRYTLRM